MPGSTERGNLSCVALLRPLPALMMSHICRGFSPAFAPIAMTSDDSTITAGREHVVRELHDLRLARAFAAEEQLAELA